MTKYVLHGGITKGERAANGSFFREVTSGMTGTVKILLNYFAREVGEWEQCAKEDKKKFLKNRENNKLEFEIANPDTLPDQLKRCDVMYMRGGTTTMLADRLSRTRDFEKLFEGKVIAGSSAGVNVLSTYHWSNEEGKIKQGFGVLAIKTKCHFRPDEREKIRMLMEHKEKLPVVVLADYQWVAMYG